MQTACRSLAEMKKYFSGVGFNSCFLGSSARETFLKAVTEQGKRADKMAVFGKILKNGVEKSQELEYN